MMCGQKEQAPAFSTLAADLRAAIQAQVPEGKEREVSLIYVGLAEEWARSARKGEPL